MPTGGMETRQLVACRAGCAGRDGTVLQKTRAGRHSRPYEDGDVARAGWRTGQAPSPYGINV